MIILGLTGSIGMGKSTAAEMVRRMNVPVYDSDAAVHAILGRGGVAIPEIRSAFPEVVVEGVVDRRRLGDRVFGDEDALARLEGIIHPLVRGVQDDFLRVCARRRASLALLDIPLLFELGLDDRCDATIVVSAPRFIQAQRVLSRPGMTREKFDGILANQMPDSEKRRRADFVVPSGSGRRRTWRELRKVMRTIEGCGSSRWPPVPYVERQIRKRSSDARDRR